MKRLFVCLLTVLFITFSIYITVLSNDVNLNSDDEIVVNDQFENSNEKDNIPVIDLEKSNNTNLYDEIKSNENNLKYGINQFEDDSESDVRNKAQNENVEVPKYTVVFLDFDEQIIDSQIVECGMGAVAPEPPKKEGFQFIGWDVSFSNVTSNLSVTAQYKNDETPLLCMNDVSAKPGEENVTIVLSVENNPGILGMILTLTYDERVMKLNNAVVGKDVDGILDFTKSKVLNSGCSFVWDGVEISPEQISDGEFLVLDFEILKEAPKGEYDVSISYAEGDIIDNNLENLDFSTKSGKVKISK